MDKLLIIKIGGNVIDDEQELNKFLVKFSSLPQKKILVHGGGKLATKLAKELNLNQTMIEGRRVTDAKTLQLVTMVYAGEINKNVVALLQAHNCNAIGLTGADGNIILAHKRTGSAVDYGYAGDVDSVQTDVLNIFLKANFTVVIAPITHDKKGQLLNTNADTISRELATSFSNEYDVHLIYCFEKEGVLLDINDDGSVIKQLNSSAFGKLKSTQKIFEGMIPKLNNAFAALEAGVKKISMGKASKLEELVMGKTGTSITNE